MILDRDLHVFLETHQSPATVINRSNLERLDRSLKHFPLFFSVTHHPTTRRPSDRRRRIRRRRLSTPKKQNPVLSNQKE
uniref:Uncharacterized protein n=1 Tax=Rhizophora mucronata TaxID=61149 RepID=A0A2P2JBL5_RHIMU